MSSDFLKVMLADLCTDVSYGYTASSISEPVGPKFLRITDIQGGAVDWASVPYCEASESAKRKNKLERGDIVIARTGNSTGENYIFESNEDTVFASYLIRFRVNPALANPYFVWLQLRTQAWWDYVSGSKSGSAQAGANAKVLGCYELNLPDRKVQNKIELIFHKLNEKIQVNQQISQTLEQMAQAIFKSWFVDFEPVKAKIAALEAGGSEDHALLAAMQTIAGSALFATDVADADAQTQLARLQTEHPEQYATLRATAELFPSAMQESELGEIPEGWNAGELSDIAMFTSNRISVEELSIETYISTENMLENKAGIRNAASLPSAATVIKFEPLHILVSNIRPYFKKIWLANFDGGRSADVLGFESKHQGTSEFLYNLLYQDQFFDYMMLTSKGAKMPRGDKDAIMQFAIAVPPVELMKYFSQRVEAFYNLINMNSSGARSLSELRDTLLPKLLSGELSLAAAEEQLTYAVEPADV